MRFRPVSIKVRSKEKRYRKNTFLKIKCRFIERLAFYHPDTFNSTQANIPGGNQITKTTEKLSSPTSVLMTVDDEASPALNLSDVETTDSWDIDNLVVLKVIVAESI